VNALLDHLRALVSFDTQNPPRNIHASDKIFAYLGDHLPRFDVSLHDEGGGCVSLLAVRGQPRWLLNVHLDTVPVSGAWERDPHALVVDVDRAYGLGACDIKGGAAAMLANADAAEDVALLFTTDEEYGHSVCVRRFLSANPAWLDDVRAVLVAEPTGCLAVTAHRGYARARRAFVADAGHSADPRGLEESAVHQLGAWLSDAVARAKTREGDGALGLTGVRFNCGVVEGGRADNVIADRASAEFSVRPPPGVDAELCARELGADEVPFVGPSCPAVDPERMATAAVEAAAALGVPASKPVSFWTEASLFTEAGLTAFVCGPGEIEQAHTADEWVGLAQLEAAREIYARAMKGGA
jgi:acetylornithine deacetylase